MAAIMYEVQFYRNGKRITPNEMNENDAAAFYASMGLYRNQFMNTFLKESRREMEENKNGNIIKPEKLTIDEVCESIDDLDEPGID